MEDLKQEFKQLITRVIERSNLLGKIARWNRLLIYLYPALELVYLLLWQHIPMTFLLMCISLARWLYLVTLILCFALDDSRGLFWSPLATALILLIQLIAFGWKSQSFVDLLIYAIFAVLAHKTYKTTDEYSQLHTQVSKAAGEAAAKIGAARVKTNVQVSTTEAIALLGKRKKIAIVMLCIALVAILFIPFTKVNASISDILTIESSLIRDYNDISGDNDKSLSDFSSLTAYLSADYYNFTHLLVFGFAFKDIGGYSSAANEITWIGSVLMIAIIVMTLWVIGRITSERKFTGLGLILTGCYILLVLYEGLCAENYFYGSLGIWMFICPLLSLLTIPVWNSAVEINSSSTNQVVSSAGRGSPLGGATPKPQNNSPANYSASHRTAESAPRSQSPANETPTPTRSVVTVNARENWKPSKTTSSSVPSAANVQTIKSSNSQPQNENLETAHPVQFPPSSSPNTPVQPTGDKIAFCGKCGARVVPNALFCKKCGAKIRG